MRRDSSCSSRRPPRHVTAFGAHTENRTPWALPFPSTTSPWGPSNSHRRRWVPSPNRWRSSSPIGRATLDIGSTVEVARGRARRRRGTGAGRNLPADLPVGCQAVRVLMLSWDFPPRATGGTAAHVEGLATSLARAGHEVVVLTIAERIAEAAYTPGGEFRVLRTAVDLPWLPPVETVARTASANHAFVKLGVTLADHDPSLAGWRPDIVHGHDWRTGWAADTLATDPRGAVRVDDARHRADAARRSAPARRPHRHQLDRVVARLPGRPTDRAHPLHGRTADHRIRARRRSRGADPQRRRPGPVGTARRSASTGREQLVASWGNVQFEKGFQVLARSINIARGTPAEHPWRDRRTRELSPGPAVADRRRGSERHRRPARLRARRPAPRHRPPRRCAW